MSLKKGILSAFDLFLNYFFWLFFYFLYELKSLFVLKISLYYAWIFILYSNLLLFSFLILKNFLCPIINYDCRQINNSNQLIQYQHNFKENNQFSNIQYIKNLIEIFQENNILNDSNLLNKETFEEIKKKVDSIYSSILRKFDKSNKQNLHKNNIKFFQYFDFSKNKIFEDDTSLYMIHCVHNLLFYIIVFICKGEFRLSKKERYQRFQFYIIYFIELLIFLQEITKINDNFFENIISSEKLKINIKNEKCLIENKINYLLNLDLKEHFIFHESEKISKFKNYFE